MALSIFSKQGVLLMRDLYNERCLILVLSSNLCHSGIFIGIYFMLTLKIWRLYKDIGLV